MNLHTYWPQPLFPEVAFTLASGAASASQLVKAGHVYKIVGNQDWYMKVSKASAGASPATTNDIFVPAGHVQVLIANVWDTINAIKSSANGSVSIVEVQMPL